MILANGGPRSLCLRRLDKVAKESKIKVYFLKIKVLLVVKIHSMQFSHRNNI